MAGAARRGWLTKFAVGGEERHTPSRAPQKALEPRNPAAARESVKPFRGPAGSIRPPSADRRRARGSGSAGRAMNRRGADLGPRRDHPCAAPAATMIERPTVRVCGGGGGRQRAMRRRGCLTQRYELQGRIHGPAHQRSERALVLSGVGHRREHVFVRLRSGSDGKLRNDRDPEAANLRIPRRSAESTPSSLQPILHRPGNGLRAGRGLALLLPEGDLPADRRRDHAAPPGRPFARRRAAATRPGRARDRWPRRCRRPAT